MKKILILPLLLLSLVSASESLNLRIREAQEALLSSGPTFELLNNYERLVTEIQMESVSPVAAAQVFYQKALVEISLNKGRAAASDLVRALRLDSTFTPAASKLIDLWMSRGQFDDIRSRFDQNTYPEVYLQMNLWEETYLKVKGMADGKVVTDELFQYFDDIILRITPELSQAYELHLQCLKHKIQNMPVDSRDELYSSIIADYSKLVKILPLHNLNQYAEFAQYLLYTQGDFQNSFSVVKNCLRMDHDYKPCATISKLYSRMQCILKPAEQYFARDDYLYHPSGNTIEVLKERLDSFSFEWPTLYKDFSGEVKIPKRELKSLPLSVTNNYDYLISQAEHFLQAEFESKKGVQQLPLVRSLNRLFCESSVMVNGDTKLYCASVDESKHKFLPKQLHKIDAYLKKGKLQEAGEMLQEYNKNVRRTDMFQKRWEPIEREEQRQQQRQQQQQQQQQEQFFRQQQQRQQQQQQQQSHMDRSKDYYKILDVPKDAGEKTIRKAYKAQTLKYHPDKYKGNDLSEKEIERKMQEINEAYEVLSNPQAKEDYDKGPHAEPHGHSFHHGGQHFYSGGRNMHFQFNAEDILNQFGGGGPNIRFQF